MAAVYVVGFFDFGACEALRRVTAGMCAVLTSEGRWGMESVAMPALGSNALMDSYASAAKVGAVEPSTMGGPALASAEWRARVEAGRAAVLRQVAFFHRELGHAKSTWKADGSRVTAADIAISQSIFAELSARFPGDDFFSEELEDGGEPLPARAEFSWVLDPIDGTNNYALGVPYCAISLALLHEGMPVYGIIYDAARRVLMHGGPGFGVWDGERCVEFAEAAFGVQSFVGFHSPYEPKYAAHAAVLAEHAKLRALGASALHMAYVGVGLLDAVVDHNVKVWDIAAAVPLVAASGRVVDYVSESPFPLKNFDVNMGRTFCVAGSRATVTRMRHLLGV